MKSYVGHMIFPSNLYLIMKTTESSYNQLKNWILEFLSKPNPAFDNLPPCPYAKKAWVEGNVEIKQFESFSKLNDDLKNISTEVVVYYFKNNVLPTCNDLEKMAEEYNKKYPKLLFYDEHPDSIEEVGGVHLNSGVCALIVQDRQDLLDKREELKETGYYDNWTPELKEKIIDR